ncbi:APC family permease [Abyssisolibacter fermentans]|uniref:APC family permease n=1 Tax=Abyssisolibacter fermentans TaxID=1766203 RepID=UPI0008379B42|nr:APC family permease [Abyssisolibacter fermentans]
MEKKGLKFFDILCLSFAAVFSLEVIASQATMGPSLIFCFIVIGLTYFLTHALICAELGSTYPDQGGIYVWVKNAYGDKWAARTTWWYWVNVAGFIPSTFVVMGGIFMQLFIPDMTVWQMVTFCIISTWVVIFFNCISLEKAKWLTTIGSICKFVVCVALIGGAMYTLITKGAQSIFNIKTMIPTLDIGFFALIPVYIYALTGFDVASCSAEEMQNPKKDVPKAIFSSGFTTLFLYVITAVSILIILPQDQVNETTGFIDAFIGVFGNSGISIVSIGIATVLAFIGCVFSWALGGNKAALEAGEAGELPAIFAKTNKHRSPVGSALLLGILATILLLVYGATANTNEGLFWTLLAFNSIIFFLPYLMMSFVFIKLRKTQKNIERPFRIPGPDWIGTLIAIIHFLFLLTGVICFFLPPEGENAITYMTSLGIGVVLVLILGEILVTKSINKNKANN